MRVTGFVSLSFVWLLSVPAFGAQTPATQAPSAPRDALAQTAWTAQMSGRVFSAETGRPLRRAVVRVATPEIREGRSATTDAQGRWLIKLLPAGRYSIMVTKGGYVSLQYGQRRPFDQGQPVDLANGQALDKVDITLPKGGVITGHINDEFGEPFADIRVTTMRYRFMNGQRRLVAVGGADTTDDIGQFRIHGLAPGEYYVCATNTALSFDTSEDRLGYAATYFPGTPVIADARRVIVTAGEETSETNFDLAPTRVANISGTATNSQGKPLANTVILMTSPLLQGGVPILNPALVRPDGTFTISNVTPGEYRLETYAVSDIQQVTASRGTAAVAETASIALTVSGEDIVGLNVVALPTTTATGRIIFEDEPEAKFPPGAVIVMALAPAATSILPGGLGRVSDDWTFEAKGMSGRRVFRVTPPKGWFLKKVALNGTDITDAGVECKPGEDITGVQITLTKRMASLTGTATSGDKAVNDFVVVAFAADRERWVTPTRFVRTAKPDASGKFVFEGLPPEEYLVAALEYLEPGEEADPEVLERLRPQAARVSLHEGDAKILTLKVGR